MKLRNIFGLTLAATLSFASCAEQDMTKVDEWLGEKFNQEILWDVDSLAFRRTAWESVDVADGLQMRKSAIKMWESVQSISYVTYSPNMFNTYIGYTGEENTVGDIASAKEGAMFAINAGGLTNGKPADFLKLDGKLINETVADPIAEETKAIVGLTANPLGVEMKISANVNEHSNFTSAIVAGHLLIRNGKELDFSGMTDEFYTTRMARTIVGGSSTGNYTLAVIDGGVAGQADGATVQEAAFVARMMGLNFAALLGSGDEVTAWAPKAGVLNGPSAGTAAKIGSVIYLGEGTARVSGAGTADSPYLIENHVHMTQMRALCKKETETFFKMVEDVDMSEVKTWTPVNFDDKFTRKVYFDGNGKKISNFAPKFVADDQTTPAEYASLFGVLYGTVKDLTIENAKVLMPLTQGTATGIIGGFLGTVQESTSMPAILENVHVVNGEVSGGRDCGLFGGQARDASLKNCTASGDITGGNADCGGFIGRAAGHMSLEECHSDVYLTPGQNPGSNMRYGGLIGFMATIGGTDTTRDDLLVKNCSSTGTFFNDAYSANTVGALIAYINSSADISESFTTLELLGSAQNEPDQGGPLGGNHANCGGIAGIVSSVGTVKISNCWTGGGKKFTSGQKAGGIVGVLEKGVLTIENCYSTYDMLCYSGAGGIFGQCKDVGATFNITKCFAWNPRLITFRATDKYSSGAFAGCIANKCTITGCYRNPAMEFVDPYRSLKDHADIEGGIPANDVAENPASPSANNNAYDAQPSTEATLSAAAQKAGWSASVWDFSGDVPVLKNNN